MAIFAIGDLQGCLDPLHRLLDRIHFKPAADHLWFVGDLVNRGPQSLETLRFVRSLNMEMGDRVVTTLGNHDLFLLACAYTDKQPRRKDTISEILDAPDAAELIDWLRYQPLLHRDEPLGWTMVHAGLPGEWTLDVAAKQARAVEAELRAKDPADFLASMFGNQPERWADARTPIERLRFTVNALTRMRYCHPDGRIDVDEKRPPEEASGDLLPWYDLPDRMSADERIVFGHWSSLGAGLLPGNDGEAAMPGLRSSWCVDQGCIWGGSLTALRLDIPASGSNGRSVAISTETDESHTPVAYRVPCPGYRQIKN